MRAKNPPPISTVTVGARPAGEKHKPRAFQYNTANHRGYDKTNLFTERCQSGRMGLIRNQVYGSPVPWVRIPPSPPILN